MKYCSGKEGNVLKSEYITMVFLEKDDLGECNEQNQIKGSNNNGGNSDPADRG